MYRGSGFSRTGSGLNVAILCLAGLVVAIAVSGGWELTLAGQTVRTRSLYTPVLMLTILILIRLAQQFRPSLVALTSNDIRRFVGLTAATAVAGAIFVAPVLYAAAVRIARGEFDTPDHLLAQQSARCRSAVVDSAESQSSACAGRAGPVAVASSECLPGKRRLAAAGRDRNTGPRVARRVAAVAMVDRHDRRVRPAGTRPVHPRRRDQYLCARALGAAAVRAAGRARPHAGAIQHRPDARGRRRRGRRAHGIGPQESRAAARAPDRCRSSPRAELLPAPLTLYSAEIPPLYQRVAAAPSTVILLEIPYGVRDGVSSVGNFTARTQFFQTAHGKTVMGGYLSRIPRRRVEELQMDPVARALAILSEKGRLQPADETAMLDAAPDFLRRNRIGFVVIDRDRTDATFEALVIKAFRLRHLETNGSLSLFATD